MTGTARGQSQLRQAFLFTNTYGNAGFPRDVSPALYRTDRASRQGRGQDHDRTTDRWPACRPTL
jgi:hypothetical protein